MRPGNAMGDDTPVVVVFRRWKAKPHTLIALFPTLPATHDGRYCMSYEHVGQHGGADYRGVLRRSVRVTQPEAEKDGLYNELLRIGYKLDVRMLFSNHWKREVR